MATNNFKAFGIGASANVTSQADYEALTALLTGFQSGKASSAQINKALRQSSTMAYVLAQFISDSASVDVLDNGTPATILSNMKAAMTALTPGRLLNVQIITATGTYTPTAGTNKAVVEMVGGGGASGAVPASSSSANFASAGGGSGAYIRFLLSIVPSSVSVTIGAAGALNGGTGGSGGATSFGSYASVGGGGGSTYAQASNEMLLATAGARGASITSSGVQVLNQCLGEPGGTAFMMSGGNGSFNNGGSSKLGAGGLGSGNGSGSAASGYGSGGGGSMTVVSSTGTSYPGAVGTPGIIIVWEYA